MVSLQSCLLLSVCLAVGATARCPPGTVQGLRSSDCYMFGPAGKNTSWHVAQGICAAKGGSLASIEGPLDNELLHGMAKVLGPGSGAGAFWLGGYRNGSDSKQWRWLDGNAFDYTNWASRRVPLPLSRTVGQRHAQYSCLSINASTGEWQAAACEAAKSFICKLRSCRTPPAEVDGKCEEGWTYIDEAKKCFKALPGSADWKATYASCKLLNAEMVTIATGAENSAITDFLASKSISTAAIAMRNVAAVKYTNGGGEGQVSSVQAWVWIDGAFPFYTNWANSGPTSGSWSEGADCAFLDVARGGTWYNEVCSGSAKAVTGYDTLTTPVCQTQPLAKSDLIVQQRTKLFGPVVY